VGQRIGYGAAGRAFAGVDGDALVDRFHDAGRTDGALGIGRLTAAADTGAVQQARVLVNQRQAGNNSVFQLLQPQKTPAPRPLARSRRG